MHKISPADELAEVRAEIARLKAREAELRADFLKFPDSGATGRWHRVEVVESRARIFDAQLLPPAIRENPRYWRERVTQYVRCLPVQVAGANPRPGWPIRRDAVGQEGALH